MGNQLRELAAAGQSVWLDNIRRSMFASGELQKLIDQGLRGHDLQPDDLRTRHRHGTDYDEQLKTLIGNESRPAATSSRRWRCKTSAAPATCSRPLYERRTALDGYVSLEVSPTLAHDTEARSPPPRGCGKPSTGRT